MAKQNILSFELNNKMYPQSPTNNINPQNAYWEENQFQKSGNISLSSRRFQKRIMTRVMSNTAADMNLKIIQKNSEDYIKTDALSDNYKNSGVIGKNNSSYNFNRNSVSILQINKGKIQTDRIKSSNVNSKPISISQYKKQNIINREFLKNNFAKK